MDISRILKLILIVELIVLLGNAVAISRDYQDSWILEGLEIPFVAFMITYAAYVFIENKISWLIAFTLMVRSVIALLPNLKYDWFLGTAIDQNSHYRLVLDIYNGGHVPEPIPGVMYAGTPNMHLFFATYSIVTNVPVLYTFKYLPVLSWLVYPLIIYLIMRKSLPIKKNPSILKYAVFISAIPVRATRSYIVVGTLFGVLLAFLVITQFVNVLQTNSRKYLIIALVCSFALVGTHSYSSIMLMIGFLITYLAYNINYIKNKFKIFEARALNITSITFLIVLNALWLSYVATDLFTGSFANIITTYMNAIMGVNVTGFPTTGIRSRFFELNFLDKLRIIFLNYGGDIGLLFLMLIGILILVKKFRSSKSLTFLSFYIVSLWLFNIVQITLAGAQAGLFEFDRILAHTLLMSPIFFGISLYYIQKRTRNSKLIMFIILLLMMLATVELYRCQPLVPPASAIGFPSNEPIVYVNSVNSVYQRFMINYAERYCGEGMLIASDAVTKNQIIGLTSSNFSSSHLIWYNPFSRLLDESIPKMEYDYFLIHLPGKSGAFYEKVEIRTKNLILEAINNSNILYTNSESYILAKPFMNSTAIP